MSSLTNMIKSLRHKGKITNEQCEKLLKKLHGHDLEIINGKRAKWVCYKTFYKCSACGGFDSSGIAPYCKNCGSRMVNYVIQALFGGEKQFNKRLRILDSKLNHEETKEDL